MKKNEKKKRACILLEEINVETKIFLVSSWQWNLAGVGENFHRNRTSNCIFFASWTLERRHLDPIVVIRFCFFSSFSLFSFSSLLHVVRSSYHMCNIFYEDEVNCLADDRFPKRSSRFPKFLSRIRFGPRKSWAATTRALARKFLRKLRNLSNVRWIVKCEKKKRLVVNVFKYEQVRKTKALQGCRSTHSEFFAKIRREFRMEYQQNSSCSAKIRRSRALTIPFASQKFRTAKRSSVLRSFVLRSSVSAGNFQSRREVNR